MNHGRTITIFIILALIVMFLTLKYVTEDREYNPNCSTTVERYQNEECKR